MVIKAKINQTYEFNNTDSTSVNTDTSLLLDIIDKSPFNIKEKIINNEKFKIIKSNFKNIFFPKIIPDSKGKIIYEFEPGYNLLITPKILISSSEILKNKNIEFVSKFNLLKKESKYQLKLKTGQIVGEFFNLNNNENYIIKTNDKIKIKFENNIKEFKENKKVKSGFNILKAKTDLNSVKEIFNKKKQVKSVFKWNCNNQKFEFILKTKNNEYLGNEFSLKEGDVYFLNIEFESNASEIKVEESYGSIDIEEEKEILVYNEIEKSYYNKIKKEEEFSISYKDNTDHEIYNSNFQEPKFSSEIITIEKLIREREIEEFEEIGENYSLEDAVEEKSESELEPIYEILTNKLSYIEQKKELYEIICVNYKSTNYNLHKDNMNKYN